MVGVHDRNMSAAKLWKKWTVVSAIMPARWRAECYGPEK